jgi:ankyrin repeat protein
MSLVAALKAKDKNAKKIAEKPDANVEEVDSEGSNALHLAVKLGDGDVVKALLKRKLKLDAQDKAGNTALALCAPIGDWKTAELLLKAGANPEVTNGAGDTFFHLLLTSPKFHKDAIKLIKSACEAGYGGVNARNKAGATIVHIAAQRANLELIQILCKAKADANVQNIKGETPLFLAVNEGGSPPAVSALLLAGGDITIRSLNGQSVVEAAKARPDVFQAIKNYVSTVPGGERKLRANSEEPIYQATTIAQLPEDIMAVVKHSQLDHALIQKNWDVFCSIIHFTQKKRIAKDEVDAALHKDKVKATLLASMSAESLSNSGEKPDPALLPPKDPVDAIIASKLDTLIDKGDPKALYGKKMVSIGKGGFGMVFSAIGADKQKVAIKRMPHASERDRRINMREVYFLKQLQHPNIVQLKGAYDMVQDHELWVLFELMEGGTLDDAVAEEHASFQEKHIAFAAHEILEALAFLHKRKFAHRDLKAANIMLSVEGVVKVIDFGLCTDMNPGPRTESVGSPFWMPPEMIQKQPHNISADIWSMAISVIELANKAPPNTESVLRAMFHTAVEECPLPTFTKPANWSNEFKDFIGRCLVRNPAKRATSEELLTHPFMGKACKQADMKTLLRQIFMGNQLKQNGFF